MLLLCVQGEDEAGAFGELWVYSEFTAHLHGHLLADGQSEPVANGEVVDFEEGLEDILMLLYWNVAARVGDQELMLVGAAFLVLQPHVTVGRGIDGSIAEEVKKDMRNVLLVDFGAHIRSVYSKGHSAAHFVLHLFHDPLAEGRQLDIFEFHGLFHRGIKLGEGLDVF